MEPFGWHDVHLVVDVVAGGLATRAALALPFFLKQVWLKAFVEPVAFLVGRAGYERLDKLAGDRLPDLPE